MAAYEHFEHSLAAARSLTDMYLELRRSRNLGRRGRLTPANEDLLWLPRSAVVAAISALDAYVHSVVADQLPHALTADPAPDALCDAMAKIFPIKNGDGFRKALPMILHANAALQLAKQLNEEVLSYASFQAPEKLQEAYALIGHANVFDTVAEQWPGPNTAPNDLKRGLANYVKRRNQIAHEGDREANGSVRHMAPVYSMNCSNFVESLVTRLNRTVYGQPNA